MKLRRNLVVIGLLLAIGLVFGLSLELKNLKLEQLDAKYEDDWKKTLNDHEQQINKDNNINNDDNNNQKGLYNDFYSLMDNANTIIIKSKSLTAEAKGSLDAVITKEGLKKAGVPEIALNIVPGNNVTLKDQAKFVTKKDKLGNAYFGLGFYGTLPDYAQGKIDIPNRLNVAQYFDGMQYYVGDSKDKRVEQNCDPYVDTFTPMTYDEYIQKYKNNLGDIFYILNEETLSEECIKSFKKPVTPLDTYEVQLNITGESLQKVTANVGVQHQYMLGMASDSKYNSLSIALSYDYQGQLTKMVVRENFDTTYRIAISGLTINAPINIQFSWTQNFKYTYKNLIDMPSFN